MRALIWLAVAACWSSRPAPEPPSNHAAVTTPPSPPPAIELRATLRIDAAPGPRGLQGVWLELGDGTRYVIDDRARPIWRGFAGAQVIATGHCVGARASDAPYFRVDRLRLAPTVAMATPLIEVGPEAVLRGRFVEVAFPIGSKRAGSTELRFDETGGGSYVVHGRDDGVPAPAPGPATIRARAVEVNAAYAATTGGARVWIVELDATERPAPRAIACPGDHD